MGDPEVELGTIVAKLSKLEQGLAAPSPFRRPS